MTQTLRLVVQRHNNSDVVPIGVSIRGLGSHQSLIFRYPPLNLVMMLKQLDMDLDIKNSILRTGNPHNKLTFFPTPKRSRDQRALRKSRKNSLHSSK